MGSRVGRSPLQLSSLSTSKLRRLHHFVLERPNFYTQPETLALHRSVRRFVWTYKVCSASKRPTKL